jgi:hypothetical protein
MKGGKRQYDDEAPFQALPLSVKALTLDALFTPFILAMFNSFYKHAFNLLDLFLLS